MKLFNNKAGALFQTVKNFVTYNTGNNRLATILQVNQVITAINSLVGGYRAYDVQFTGSGVLPAPAFLTQKSMAAGECSFGCNYTPAQGCDVCGCAPACTGNDQFAMNMQIVPVGVGIYTLTINFGKSNTYDYTNLKGIGIYPSVLALLIERIAINQISVTPTQAIYEIVTTSGGAPANGVIDKLIFQFRFYGAIFEPIAG